MKQQLKRIVRRIVPAEEKWPDPPVKAADSQYSMVFSLDDDPHGPTPGLIELGLKAVQTALEQVSMDDLAARAGGEYFPNQFPGEHYKLLAALMLLLKPRVVIEIGTFTGLSALAMKKYLPAEGKIFTFDLKPWNSIPETILRDSDFADGRLVQYTDNVADMAAVELRRRELESADFMFIDGPKDHVSEFKFIENFQKLRFARPPIMLFDDTRLWSMLKFWRTLAYPKLDLTSFGHWSGTGLVEWK